ncbi:MAG: MOSC domain-containing protein, partial [Acidimicrobiales bacterium]
HLDVAEIDLDGVRGDRLLRVDVGSEFVTARTRPGLLGIQATIGPAGEPAIDGCDWRTDRAGATLERAGAGGRFSSTHTGERFDSSPVHLVGEGTVEALGTDVRRLRPNLIVAGLAPLAEDGWIDTEIAVGDAVLSVRERCVRCVITTFDPDSLSQDAGVLRRINSDFDGRIGVLCEVARPGVVRPGEPVEIRT